MARIRSIKPEFWDDETVSSLPIGCRLLFIGLWNFADDFGVIRNSDKYIKTKVFPFDDNIKISDVSKWLALLTEHRFIVHITYNEDHFLVIRSFLKHQKIDNRYAKYIIPKEIVISLLEKAHETTPCSRCEPTVVTPLPQREPTVVTSQDRIGEDRIGEEGSVCATHTHTHTQEDVSNFEKFNKWIDENAPSVGKMDDKFKIDQFLKIKKDFTIDQIQNLLIKMHNYKPLRKKNKSAYLTFLNWSKLEWNVQQSTQPKELILDESNFNFDGTKG